MSAPAPLLDYFRRGEVSREVRLAAAQATIAPPAHEQASILILLASEPDQEIRAAALATLDRIPRDVLEGFLARADVAPEVLIYFAERGARPGPVPASDDGPLIDTATENEAAIQELETETRAETVLQKLQHMSFTERVKAAMRGTREVRAILIRDPNRPVCAAVIMNPRITDQEIETIAALKSVNEEVLRLIGISRNWTRSYPVIHNLVRNPKTPVALTLNFLNRIQSRDLRALGQNKNIPEVVRTMANRMYVKRQAG